MAIEDSRLRSRPAICHRWSLWFVLTAHYFKTSTTKPEAHNVLHCCQRRTEPRTQPKITRRPTDNFVKFGPVVFEIQSKYTAKGLEASYKLLANTMHVIHVKSNKH